MAMTLTQVYPPNRSITLVGRGGPDQGFNVGGEQRHVISWAPGNPVGSAQILGASEAPSNLSGRWMPSVVTPKNNAILVNFPAIGPAGQPAPGFLGGKVFVGTVPIPQQYARTPVALMEAIDMLRYEGIPCQLQWETIERYGLVGNVNFEYVSIDDIAWTMQFDVTGRSIRQPLPLPTVSVNVPGLLAALFEAIQAVIDKIRSLLEVATRWSNIVAGLTARVFAALEELFSLLDQARDIAFAPLTNIDTIIAGLLNVKQSAIDFRNGLRNAPSPQVLAYRGGTLTDVHEDTLLAIALIEAILEAGADAALRAQQLEELQAPVSIDSVTAVDGQTLMSLARAYYGDASEWERIANYNGLSSWSVNPGQLLLIPLG